MRKIKTTMPQSKPFLNRIFAIFFVILTLTYMWTVVNGLASTPIQLLTDALGSRLFAIILFYSTVLIGLPIIVIGLFAEIWKPSLDFTLNKDKGWRTMSIHSVYSFCFNQCLLVDNIQLGLVGRRLAENNCSIFCRRLFYGRHQFFIINVWNTFSYQLYS